MKTLICLAICQPAQTTLAKQCGKAAKFLVSMQCVCSIRGYLPGCVLNESEESERSQQEL